MVMPAWAYHCGQIDSQLLLDRDEQQGRRQLYDLDQLIVESKRD